MHAKLIVVGGKATKDAISLELPTIIGRSEEADLTVAHRTISRRHAELFESDGKVMIRDLGSLNGVLIDGQRVKEAPLPNGTQFTIGPLTFRVEYEHSTAKKGPSPQAAPKPAAPVKPAAPAAAAAKPVAPAAAVTKPVVAPAAPPAAAATMATDMPDFEPLEMEEEPAIGAAAPEKVAAKAGAEKSEKKAPVSSGDPFEDLLSELE
jgi:predicted component of type VI protein secretion system